MYKENSFLRREFRSKQVYFILVLRRVLLVYDSIGTESTTTRGDRRDRVQHYFKSLQYFGRSHYHLPRNYLLKTFEGMIFGDGCERTTWPMVVLNKDLKLRVFYISQRQKICVNFATLWQTFGTLIYYLTWTMKKKDLFYLQRFAWLLTTIGPRPVRSKLI